MKIAFFVICFKMIKIKRQSVLILNITVSSVTRPKPKVYEFKLKSCDNADVIKLTEVELSKIVV